ncbi:MAG: hypothetical protein DSZ29_04420, partial [Aquificaceae bacterium]
IYQKKKEIPKAIEQLEKAQAIYQKIVEKDKSNAELQRSSTVPLFQLMNLYAQNKQQTLAIKSGEQAVEILNQLQQQGKLYGEHKEWPAIFKQALDQVKAGK